MTKCIKKISNLFSTLLISLLLVSCSGGDRGFIPLPETPEEEKEQDIIFTSGAVKGPLINASIDVYKFELDEGPIFHFNNGLTQWFKLLEHNTISLQDNDILLESLSASQAIANICNSILEFGFLNELDEIKREVNKASSFNAAVDIVDNYLNAQYNLSCTDTVSFDEVVSKESNELVREEIIKAKDNSATLVELKAKISAIESLNDKLLEVSSFSAAYSLLSQYKAKENNPNKLNGFDVVISEIRDLQARSSQYGLNALKLELSNYLDLFNQDLSFQSEPEVLNRLRDLKTAIDSATSIEEAESLLKETLQREGNIKAKAAYSKIIAKIISVDDLVELIDGKNTLYHSFNIKGKALELSKTVYSNETEALENLTSLVLTISSFFADNLESELRSSLVKLDQQGQPLNRLSFGITNGEGLLSGLNIKDYRGFVYLKVSSSNKTIDLNTGLAPIVKSMELLFHTDDILGYGNNQKEDETVYFLLNGEPQRDSNGKLITDQKLIDSKAGDKLLEVRPSLFASPLTSLILELSIEKLKDISNFQVDSDNDLNPENSLTEALLRQSVSENAKVISDVFGIELQPDFYLSSPLRLAQTQYSLENDISTVQHRMSIENYASFLSDIIALTNENETRITEALVKDLTDNQLDGFSGQESVDILNTIPGLSHLLQLSPSDRTIPGTNYKVSNTFYLMQQQHSIILPKESSSLFPAKQKDIAIVSPKGGVDSDNDGVFDKEDAFPTDPDKYSDLSPGYPGIWSAVVDPSQVTYMPIKSDLSFQFNVEVEQGLCVGSPCISIGQPSTVVEAKYDLISAPANHDFAFKTNPVDSVGFTAFATVPGNYLVKARFNSVSDPLKFYSVVVPIVVVDPRSFVYKFDPENPKVGEDVIVYVKATNALCALYPVCGSFNLLDDQDDFINIEKLSDILSVDKRVLRTNNVLNFSSVLSAQSALTSANLANTELRDTLSLTVRFKAGNRDFVSANYSNIVGDSEDSDGDGVTDFYDSFPQDPLCSNELDGILDTNFDGSVNELDSPFCLENIRAQATLMLDIPFNGEKWLYHPSWQYIVRANLVSSGFKGVIELPTLTGTKELIERVKLDSVLKRVYIIYKNGAIDVYSLESNTLKDFVPHQNFNKVNSIHITGSYVLVEYQDNNLVKLYNQSGIEANISSQVAYPYPGNQVTLQIDGQNLNSSTNNLFSINWTLERESSDLDANGFFIVDKISDLIISNDSLTLDSGQTQFSDVLTIALNFSFEGRTITLNKNIFVLGTQSISFLEKTFEPDAPINIHFENFTPSNLPQNNKTIFVKWLKNKVAPVNYKFISSDYNYPYTLEVGPADLAKKNYELGDMIKAEVYLQHGAKQLKITQLEAVILGDLAKLTPVLNQVDTVINPITRLVDIQLIKPYSDKAFFDNLTLIPIWKINQQRIDGENQFHFPSLSSTQIKFGDVISVSYKISLNGLSVETEDLVAGVLDFDQTNSQFNLSRLVYDIDSDPSLSELDFSSSELQLIEAVWKINGQVDNTVSSFTYPASKLNYGDVIELLVIPKGTDIDRAYTHVAKAFFGVNLDSVANNTSDSVNDLDSDNDGVPNHLDYFRYDAACSVITDGAPDDLDGDGIPDLDELKNSLTISPVNRDSDGDGLSDFEELNHISYVTDPTNADSDGDGYSDSIELDLGTDPNNPADPGVTTNDNDFDGLSNDLELRYNTKVNVADTDKDGLSDWYEINVSNTEPLNPDSDGDKLSDGAEERITKTNPNLADDDSDGLMDGLEVVLRLNPKSQDTDGDSILDPDESGYNFDMVISSIISIQDLKDYSNNFSKLEKIKQGTCYKTWLANRPIDKVVYSNEQQENAASEQRLAFANPDWADVVIYDAKADLFLTSAKLSNLNSGASSVAFDVSNPDLIYLGLNNGQVHTFNSSTNALTLLFDTGISAPVTTLIVQGVIIIAEQEDENDHIKHSYYRLSDTTTVPYGSRTSSVSYQYSAWLDTNNIVLMSLNNQEGSSSLVREVFDTSTSSPITSTDVIELLDVFEGPLFVESLGGKTYVHSSNGQTYDVAANSVFSGFISPYQKVINHQEHRVLAQISSSYLQITTLQDFLNDNYWQFNSQLNNESLVDVIPTGKNLLAISKKAPTNATSMDGTIAFQKIILGDSSGDGLPDWWNRLSDTLTEADFLNYQLNGDARIPDFLDGTPNIDDSVTPPILQDSDGDFICDHWETGLFNTDPNSADTDNDGMSDAQELNIDSLSDCADYPVFSLVSDPLVPDTDGDGLLDGEEFFTYLTNPLSSDSDQDGLTDYQEIFTSFTDPNLADSDTNGVLDGDENSDADTLTDAEEINIYHTNHLNNDTDNDGLDDDVEIYIHGTNPNHDDTDGDGLTDLFEVTTNDTDNLYLTDGNSIDTDNDGVSDDVEINLSGEYPFSSNPLVTDTDGDGLSDFQEFTFRYEYSEDQLFFAEFFNTQSDPSNWDTDNDGICDKWEVLNFFSNPAEPDTDGDGLTDDRELGISLIGNCAQLPATLPISSLLSRDTDSDRILDGDEVLVLGTDPKDKDSDDNRVNDDLEDPDSDGLTNYQELYQTNTNPLVADSDGNGINDANEDSDGDGLTNIEELNKYGTDPLKADTDGDGLSDKEEIDLNINPLVEDSDDDGLSDLEEIITYRTNPLLQDTDHDGRSDYDETKGSPTTNPLNPDSDHDFLLDGREVQINTNPLQPDTDGDGIPDGIEVNYLGTDPRATDSDNDGLDDDYEAWVYAYSIVNGVETDQLLKVGVNQDADLNSNRSLGSVWPNPVKFSTYSRHYEVIDLGVPAQPYLTKGRLYIKRFSNPALKDSDGDGLFDATEFEIERVLGVHYNQNKVPGAFNPLLSNCLNFRVSDPLNVSTWGDGSDPDCDDIPDYYELNYSLTDSTLGDSNGNGIDDSRENPDGDLLNNLQEIRFGSDPFVFDVSLSKIDSDNDGLDDFGVRLAISDSDNDGLPDVLETRLFIGLNINNVDSNSNGVADGDEDADGDSLTNYEEVLYKTDPLTPDMFPDTDGDGLTDFQELFITMTNFLNPDTPDVVVENPNNPGELIELSNGVRDGMEDPDGDSISNIDEFKLGGNPLKFDPKIISDLDGDGLSDIEETIFTLTDPLLADSDGDGILDDADDQDGDGLTNFQELHITFTNPILADSDGNGINDNLEDTDGDNLTNYQELKLGSNPIQFDDVVRLQKHSDNDGIVDIYEIKLMNTDPTRIDTFNLGRMDSEIDSDNDGLTLLVEVLTGRNDSVRDVFVDTDSDGLSDIQERLVTLTLETAADTNNNGINDAFEDADTDGYTNLEELILLKDPNSFTNLILTDAQKDADGDLLNNLSDQSTLGGSLAVNIADQDGDGIIDGIEQLILGSDVLMTDSDNDGLTDFAEIQSLSYREVAADAFCTENEVRLSEITGKDYCFSITYNSYPTYKDSDGDGVDDRSIRESDGMVIFDHYPLDASCHLLGDGFVKEDGSIQCFSSYMALVDNIDSIKYTQWIDTSGSTPVSHADIFFSDSEWSQLIVYNALTALYESSLSLRTEIDSVQVGLADYSVEGNMLITLYTDGTLEKVNLQTRVSETLGRYSDTGLEPYMVRVISPSRIVIGFKADGNSSLMLINDFGTILDTISTSRMDFKEGIKLCSNVGCDQLASLFGVDLSLDGSTTHIVRLRIDIANDLFLGDVIRSEDLPAGESLSGPIKFAQDMSGIQTGSGHIYEIPSDKIHDLDLNITLSTTSLAYQFGSNIYSRFFDFVEYADHFVGVVDVNLANSPSSGDYPVLNNGLFISELESIKDSILVKLPGDDSINDLKVLNQYLLSPSNASETVLKLIPFEKTPAYEMAVIKKLENRISIEQLGLLDVDGDIMTGLYERLFGLDDSNSTDKFLDLDGDGLTNIEEYFFATKPNHGDSDADGWSDLTELLLGTDPNNALSY